MSACNSKTENMDQRSISLPVDFTAFEQQHEVHQAGPNICSLPEHALDLVAGCLVPISGSQQNFRQSCRAFRAAGHRALTATLDLYELCGWGSGSRNVPQQALHTAELCPNAKSITFPSGWRHQNIQQLLRHASLRVRVWRRLTILSMHFHAFSPSTAAALAQLAPSLSQLTLSLDLAFEQTRSQAWRVRALLQLPQLASLTVEPDLRPEALHVLSCLPRLRQLQLVGTPQHSSHPEASLAALAGLQQLTSLRFNWQAGRTLNDARLLSALTHLQELQMWLSGGGRELPPCSSKPLPGMLEAVGQLTGLTRLELLQGLYMSWDLRQMRHLSILGQLQVLGLHDSVLCDDELALLAPCSSLQHLRADTLKLPAISITAAAVVQQPGQPAAAAAADAAAGAAAAAMGADEAGADAANTSSSSALALVVLARLKQLEVNMLQLGLWQMKEVCPQLTSLTPLDCTLGPKGHGVVWELGSLEGHPNLQVLGLMVGALGTTCSCHKSFKTANCAESLAAAVVRVILQSAGISRGGGGPGGCSMQQLVALLHSLPRLQQLHLWGHAGGVSGKILASIKLPRGNSSNTSCSSSSASPVAMAASPVSSCLGSPSSHCCSAGSSRSSLTVDLPAAASAEGGGCLDSPGSSIPSQTPSPRSNSGAGWSGEHYQGVGSGIAAAVSDLLSSFGSLLSPRSRTGGDGAAPAAAAAAVPAALPAPAFQGGSWHRPSDADAGGSDATAGAPSSSSSSSSQLCKGSKLNAWPPGASSSRSTSSADEQLVLQLLQELPQLQVLQLKKCSHLLQGGWVLAGQCCGRDGCAAVVVSKH